ncbi:eukaryotic translation initiation factor 5B-like [Palaemon carinicauda]|uniref:eukaryotic translation initiation factor 5B-like n=1 Tax=Palaemon carinicauda TaxID=392227 RepID=UPI0035B5CC11
MFYEGEIVWEGVAGLLLHGSMKVLYGLADISIELLEGLFMVYIFLNFLIYWFEVVIDAIDGEENEDDTTVARPVEKNRTTRESVIEEVNSEETDSTESESSLSDDQQTVGTIEDTLNVRESSAKKGKDFNPSMTSEQDSDLESECEQVSENESECEQVSQSPGLSVIPKVDETKQTIHHSINIKDEMITFSQQSQLVKRQRQEMKQQKQASNQPLISLRETTTIISQHSGPQGNVMTRRTQINQQSQIWSHELPNRSEEVFIDEMTDEEGINQECDNATEVQTLLHRKESKSVQGLTQQDDEESRSMQDSIQDCENRQSSRLQKYSEVQSGQHGDLENMTDHHKTLKQETVTLQGKPDTGILGLENDHSYTLKQESDDENQQCDEVHKHHEKGNSPSFKDEINSVKDDSNQQLGRSQNTAFNPLIKEEMEDANYIESHYPQTLLQPCDEIKDKERQKSELCCQSKEEMEILMQDMKEDTDNQNERRDSKVNVGESRVWKEHIVVHSQPYREDTKDNKEQPILQCQQEIEEPNIQSCDADVQDTKVFPYYLEVEKEDEDYVQSHDTEVEFDKIPDENSAVVYGQSCVEDNHNDKEQHNQICEQEMEELCIQGQSEDPDIEDTEGFANSTKEKEEDYIEPHDTKVSVEESHDQKPITAVHSQPCEEETDDIEQQHKQGTQPLTQDSKDTEIVTKTDNLEPQLPRNLRLQQIVCHARITMKRNKQ